MLHIAWLSHVLGQDSCQLLI